MLLLLNILLFTRNFPSIIGPSLGEKSLHVNQVGFHLPEPDGVCGNLGDTDHIDALSKNTRLETRGSKIIEEEFGQMLEGCFGGIGRWLYRTLNKKKTPMKREKYGRKLSESPTEAQASTVQQRGGHEDSSDCCCTRCCMKGCPLCCDVCVKPACFCFHLPWLILGSVCTCSCRPFKWWFDEFNRA